jgi:hypothetical protein
MFLIFIWLDLVMGFDMPYQVLLIREELLTSLALKLLNSRFFLLRCLLILVDRQIQFCLYLNRKIGGNDLQCNFWGFDYHLLYLCWGLLSKDILQSRNLLLSDILMLSKQEILSAAHILTVIYYNFTF